MQLSSATGTHEPRLGEFGFAGDDHVVPFEVGALDIRGRAVQLGGLLDSILSRHETTNSFVSMDKQDSSRLISVDTLDISVRL